MYDAFGLVIFDGDIFEALLTFIGDSLIFQEF